MTDRPHERPPKARPKHHGRTTTDPETVKAVMHNEWGDPIGGPLPDGRHFVDTKIGKARR